MQIIDVIAPPTIAIHKIGILINLLNLKKIIRIRARPYPPNFKSRAARIIDPATGASTWAFGSHRWKRYIGSFTRNAVIIIIQHIVIGAEDE